MIKFPAIISKQTPISLKERERRRRKSCVQGERDDAQNNQDILYC